MNKTLHENNALVIVVATVAEAQPFISHFNLSKTDQNHFPVYSSENCRLIVSGIGAVKCACAVGFVANVCDFENPRWLNFGIAGHRTASIGQLFGVSKSINVDDNKSRILTPILSEGATCYTVRRPDTEYRNNGLYDMECAAFIEASLHFSKMKHIYAIKLVSDNQQTALPTRDAAAALIVNNASKITSATKRILED